MNEVDEGDEVGTRSELVSVRRGLMKQVFKKRVDLCLRRQELARAQLESDDAVYEEMKRAGQASVRRVEEELAVLVRKTAEVSEVIKDFPRLQGMERSLETNMKLLEKLQSTSTKASQKKGKKLAKSMENSKRRLRNLRAKLRLEPNPMAEPASAHPPQQRSQREIPHESSPPPMSDSDDEIAVLEMPPKKIEVLSLSPDRPVIPTGAVRTSSSGDDPSAALPKPPPMNYTSVRLAELNAFRRNLLATVSEAAAKVRRRRERLSKAALQPDEETKGRREASVQRAEEALADLKRTTVDSLQLNLELLLSFQSSVAEHSEGIALQLTESLEECEVRLRGFRAELQLTPSTLAEPGPPTLQRSPKDGQSSVAFPPTPPPTPDDDDVQIIETPYKKSRFQGPDRPSSAPEAVPATDVQADPTLPQPPTSSLAMPPAVLTMLPGLPFPVLILPPNYGDWARAFASAQPTPPAFSGVAHSGGTPR